MGSDTRGRGGGDRGQDQSGAAEGTYRDGLKALVEGLLAGR
ncbi:hypothetical protein [Streptomyces drozdowiczii]|nr:hypothetical protein [Streptomyces drozdowiczii]